MAGFSPGTVCFSTAALVFPALAGIEAEPVPVTSVSATVVSKILPILVVLG